MVTGEIGLLGMENIRSTPSVHRHMYKMQKLICNTSGTVCQLYSWQKPRKVSEDEKTLCTCAVLFFSCRTLFILLWFSIGRKGAKGEKGVSFVYFSEQNRCALEDNPSCVMNAAWTCSADKIALEKPSWISHWPFFRSQRAQVAKCATATSIQRERK